MPKNNRNSYCFLTWWSPNPRNFFYFLAWRSSSPRNSTPSKLWTTRAILGLTGPKALLYVVKPGADAYTSMRVPGRVVPSLVVLIGKVNGGVRGIPSFFCGGCGGRQPPGMRGVRGAAASRGSPGSSFYSIFLELNGDLTSPLLFKGVIDDAWSDLPKFTGNEKFTKSTKIDQNRWTSMKNNENESESDEIRRKMMKYWRKSMKNGEKLTGNDEKMDQTDLNTNQGWLGWSS